MSSSSSIPWEAPINLINGLLLIPAYHLGGSRHCYGTFVCHLLKHQGTRSSNGSASGGSSGVQQCYPLFRIPRPDIPGPPRVRRLPPTTGPVGRWQLFRARDSQRPQGSHLSLQTWRRWWRRFQTGSWAEKTGKTKGLWKIHNFCTFGLVESHFCFISFFLMSFSVLKRASVGGAIFSNHSEATCFVTRDCAMYGISGHCHMAASRPSSF